jgi:hypothetical protein
LYNAFVSSISACLSKTLICRSMPCEAIFACKVISSILFLCSCFAWKSPRTCGKNEVLNPNRLPRSAIIGLYLFKCPFYGARLPIRNSQPAFAIIPAHRPQCRRPCHHSVHRNQSADHYSASLRLAQAVAPMKPTTIPVCATRNVFKKPEAAFIRSIAINGDKSANTAMIVDSMATHAIRRCWSCILSLFSIWIILSDVQVPHLKRRRRHQCQTDQILSPAVVVLSCVFPTLKQTGTTLYPLFFRILP